MSSRAAALGACAYFTLGAASHAHHSIAGVYDYSKQVTLEAVVREFQFVNPHPMIVVGVAEQDGATELWTLEMDNRWELAELGFEPDTLKPGDAIRVTGSLARERENALYIRRLERPADGFSYQHHP